MTDRLTKRVALAAAAILVVVFAACAASLSWAGAAGKPAAEQSVTEKMPDWLYTMSMNRAAVCDDPVPDSLEWCLTTAAEAKRALDHQQASIAVADKRLYVVVMRGTFTYTTASIPPGAQLPTGGTLILWVDAASQELFRFSVWPAGVDTSGLGAMKTVK